MSRARLSPCHTCSAGIDEPCRSLTSGTGYQPLDWFHVGRGDDENVPAGTLDPSCLPGPGETKVFDMRVQVSDLDFQLLNDALKSRCYKCNGTNLKLREEEPIPGIPFQILSYTCQDCGIDSTKKKGE